MVRDNFEAFAALPTYIGRNTVMFHTIEIGDAHPFRLKQRPISFVTQLYLEQEVEN